MNSPTTSTPSPAPWRPTLENTEEKITAKVALVQKIVLEKAGLALSADEIVKIHLLSMEPDFLARSLVFSITGNPIDLSEEGDESPEEAAASAPQA